MKSDQAGTTKDLNAIVLQQSGLVKDFPIAETIWPARAWGAEDLSETECLCWM